MTKSAQRKPGKPAKKYSQAARLHDVIRILEARYGATVDELAEECGVTRRTVYRDLDAIRDAGYPLISEPEADGQVLYSFMTGFKKLPPITFSLEELMTLYLCRGQLGFLHAPLFRMILMPSSVASIPACLRAAWRIWNGSQKQRPPNSRGREIMP